MTPRALTVPLVGFSPTTPQRFAGIRTEPACLLCHGPAVAAPVQSAIRARYPQDAATGFEEGSLRGAFWVEVPMSQTASAAATTTPAPATDAVVDHRIAIALSPTHAAALREEMRGQLMALQGIIGGLAAQDWKAVETLADARGPGKGGGRGQGFRAQLPGAWFDVARPMHMEYAAIVEEARNGKRVDAALRTLEAVTAQCTACHATYRIEERTNAP